MASEWPGDWVSAAEKQRRRVEEKVDLPAGEKTGPSYTNDHGTRYLVGDMDDADEYIQMWGDVPENTC